MPSRSSPRYTRLAKCGMTCFDRWPLTCLSEAGGFAHRGFAPQMCDFDGDTREEKQMLLGARRRIEKIAYAYLEKENITPNGSSPPSAPQNDINI